MLIKRNWSQELQLSIFIYLTPVSDQTTSQDWLSFIGNQKFYFQLSERRIQVEVTFMSNF